MANPSANALLSRINKNRRLHHRLGKIFGYFFGLIGLTGILLGWEIRFGGGSGGPPPHGTSTDLAQWKPLATLVEAARQTVRDSSHGKMPGSIRRLEARPEMGIVLVQFEQAPWSAQVDGASGRVLGLEKRRFNLVKAIHEGSIIDELVGTHDVFVKLYTTIIGGVLLTLVFTGFWLWYGPGLMVRLRLGRSQQDIP